MMTGRRVVVHLFTLFLILVLAQTAAEAHTITSPDTVGDVGLHTSLALDAAGNPLVSYYDATNGDLKVLHCNDPDCLGDNESITSPDTVGDAGLYTSLALDAAGNPLVSYYDATNGDLKVMHCNDANCAGNDESITSPDATGDVGLYTSLALDAAGNPLVSYYDATNGDLKVMHCNDANCAGNNESVTSPDTAGVVGTYSSLALDAAGNAVASYYDTTNGDLKIVHCNDANCAGSNESITSPDTADDVGLYTSLALDAAGYPVASYYDATDGDLKVMHCNDANCAGNNESTTNPDAAGNVGLFTSLVLDAAGNPVVSYYNSSKFDLMVVHCNDANCTGRENAFLVDAIGDTGWHTSVVLDGVGYPVISFYDVTNGDLKVLHCSYQTCATVNGSISVLDMGGSVGMHTSLALDAAGNPVVSYQQFFNGDLMILHCNDADCARSDDSITNPDTGGTVGEYTSLVLDAAGNPVVSYYDASNGDLKLMHCNDANCTGGDESITSPDVTGDVGQHTSLALDAAGNPVVSYYDASNGDLKVLHCNDANCAGGDESVTSPDTLGDVGRDTSLTLNGAGNPVASYYDASNSDLKLLVCNDPDCSGGDEMVTSPDTTGSVGRDPSLALDAAGTPVVSYHDETALDLKVLRCNDAHCAGGDESITRPDSVGHVGLYTSLVLDGSGDPVISYFDLFNADLRVLHCFNRYCGLNTAPEAIAGADAVAAEGDVVALSGSASDPDGDLLTIVWDFGDGTTVAGTLAPQHVYEDDGVYTVTLSATDEFGLATSDTLTVTVSNVAPVVAAGADVTADEGEMVSFGGSFTDGGAADTHTIAWDFGDGTTASGTLTPQHAYGEDGVYVVTLTVTDDDGGVSMDTLAVTVSNVPPVVDAGPDQMAGEGEMVSFGGSFTDGGAADTHTIAWDFGDGTTASATLTPQHTFADDGVYVVTLTVTDDDGGVGTNTLAVTVSNVAPVVDAGPNAAVQAGNAIQFAGSFDDPGADSHVISWTFGDGGTASGSLTPSHVFTNPGFYTVTLSVTDDDGGTDSDSLTVTVTDGEPPAGALFLPIFQR